MFKWKKPQPFLLLIVMVLVSTLFPVVSRAEDGIQKWTFVTEGGVASSPAIGADGTIYAGSWNSKLYAINPNGTQKWAFTTGEIIDSSPAIGADGTIYVGSWDNKLYAINPNGTQKWAFTTENALRSSPAVGTDGTIYVGSYDGKLYAINPNGTQKWAFTTGDIVESSAAIGSDGTVYVGSDDKNLYAINPNGTQKWAFTTGDIVQSSPAIGTDGAIYVGSWDGKLYAVNPNGTQKWVFTTEVGVYSSPAIGTDGTIYVGSMVGNLYAINPAGTQKWAFATGVSVYSSPAIGTDGTIYVGSMGSKLYAINGSSGGLADSPWPMFHHDLRHSGASSNNSPNKPTLSSPANGATNVSLTPLLQTGAFSDPDTGDTHYQTRWQVSKQSDFSSLIIDTKSLLYLTSLSVPEFALSETILYYWRVRFYDQHYTPSPWSDARSFTTLNTYRDQNSNGIPDLQENYSVDMDGIGGPDMNEVDIIKSVDTVVGGGNMGVSRRNEPKATAIESVDSIDPQTISQVARPYSMPLGVLAMRFTVLTPGDSISVLVFLSTQAPADARWYVYDSVGGWVDYSDHATFSTDRRSVQVELKDGGDGDADGVVNGVIVDPGGFGLAAWITGCVKDSRTGDRITTAEVTLKGTLPGPELVLKTVINGYYLSIVRPDNYFITVSAPGYSSSKATVTVPEAVITQTRDFVLAPKGKGLSCIPLLLLDD